MLATRGRLREHIATPLYRSAYLLILGAGSTSLLGFVFWVLAARNYSPEVVGINSAVLSAMILVSAACQLGLNSVLIRYLPRAGPATRRLVVGSYALSGALSALAALVAALTSPLWAPSLTFLSDSRLWLAAFVVGTTSWTIFSLQDGVMTGIRQAQWVSIKNTAFAAFKIVLLVAVATAMPRSGIFVAWIVPVLTLLVPMSFLISLRLVPKHVALAGGEPVDARRMARFASGNYVGSLFMLASTLALPIIVTNDSGARVAAYFFVPWTIAASLQLIAGYMTTSFTVEVAFDEAKLREYSRRVLLQTARLVLPLALILLVGAPYILRAFGAPYASEGAGLLRLLAVASIPNVVVALGLSVARISHNGRMLLYVQGALCVSTLGLSLLLLPRVGIEGVGVATLVSQLAVATWLILGILRPVLLGSARPMLPPDRAVQGHDS